MSKPIISVIIPVYNEATYIEQMVRSVLAQHQINFSIELLIVDGDSTDGTTHKIEQLQEEYPAIQIIRNKKRIAPAAFNQGILHAKGEYIAILGAHSKYDPNYLEICLQELMANNCAGCSGKIEVTLKDSNTQSLLIYYLLTSNFGVSSKSYRTAKEGIGEQCPFPVFRKSIFDSVGLYNEILVRNQDNDMNYRIINAGNKLYYTHKVSAYYYPKQTLRSLYDYAINTGKWNMVSLHINPKSMSLRHVVPFIFTSILLFLTVLSILSFIFLKPYSPLFYIPLSFIILFHLFIGLLESIRLFLKHHTAIVFLLPPIFFSFHFLYGYGTLKGFFSGRLKVTS